MKPEKIIPYDSPEAARIVTVTGWVSRHGRFYGDNERSARYDGCTHRPCEACGELVERSYALCTTCRKEKADARYAAVARRPWDGVSMIYSETESRFYEDLNAAMEDCASLECTPEAMQFVLCDPVYPREIDDDYWEDIFPDDFAGTLEDLDPELAELVDRVNAHIRKKIAPVSWTPGKYALDLEGIEK